FRTYLETRNSQNVRPKILPTGTLSREKDGICRYLVNLKMGVKISKILRRRKGDFQESKKDFRRNVVEDIDTRNKILKIDPVSNLNRRGNLELFENIPEFLKQYVNKTIRIEIYRFKRLDKDCSKWPKFERSCDTLRCLYLDIEHFKPLIILKDGVRTMVSKEMVGFSLYEHHGTRKARQHIKLVKMEPVDVVCHKDVNAILLIGGSFYFHLGPRKDDTTSQQNSVRRSTPCSKMTGTYTRMVEENHDVRVWWTLDVYPASRRRVDKATKRLEQYRIAMPATVMTSLDDDCKVIALERSKCTKLCFTVVPHDHHIGLL
ncbi:unnamed protein product, partial [Owenia fusiformis]